MYEHVELNQISLGKVKTTLIYIYATQFHIRAELVQNWTAVIIIIKYYNFTYENITEIAHHLLTVALCHSVDTSDHEQWQYIAMQQWRCIYIQDMFGRNDTYYDG